MALADTAALVATLELQDKFSRTAAQYERTIGGMERATASTFGRVQDQAGRGLATASRNLQNLGIVAGGLVIGGITAATRAAIDFEDAFAGIRKTVDEAELEAAGLTFEDLSDSIREMAREIPIAATELARIGEAGGALGIDPQDIEEFTRVVAELGASTVLTTDIAAQALGQLGTTLHLEGEEFREFGDALVALGNAGASTEDQIIEIATRFAAAGNAAGLSKEQILGMSSAVASMGIDAEAGGSALSRVFNNVATGIGTSSAKARAFAQALGLSAAEFKTAWANDAQGTMIEFLDVLNDLDQFQAAALLKKVGITNVRDVSAIRLMSQNIEFLNEQIAIAEGSTGALGEEAAKRFATTASQIQLVKNNLTDVGITIGEAVLPKIVELSQRFVGFINTPEAQAAIDKFAASLPGTIDRVVAIGEKLPWDAIGRAFELMGTGATAFLDAFTNLPPDAQAFILALGGLNKLTGGAVTGIFTTLASGLIKGVLGINAGVVNLNAGTVTGAGGGGTVAARGAGGGLSIISLLGLTTAAGLGAAIGANIGSAITEPIIAPARDFEEDAFRDALNSSDLPGKLDVIEEQLSSFSDPALGFPVLVNHLASFVTGQESLLTTLENQRDQLKELITQQELQRHVIRENNTSALTDRRQGNQFLANIKAKNEELARLGQTSIARLSAIERKNFSPTVRVSSTITSNVSITDITRRLVTQRIAVGGTGGITIE